MNPGKKSGASRLELVKEARELSVSGMTTSEIANWLGLEESEIRKLSD